MANLLHLLTTLRLKHIAHVLPLTRLPSSLTPVQPVIYIWTVQTLNPSNLHPLVLSMDLEMVAERSKVMVKPNFTPNYQLVANLFSSYRVHAMCQTPHPRSSQSLALTKRIVTPYLVMGSVLLLRIETVANSSMMR